MNNRSIFSLAILSTMLIHCSMSSDVKATRETSDKIEAQSGNIASTSSDIYNGARKDVSDKGINKSWAKLTSAPDDITRVEAAEEYCSYFLFQTWTGHAGDNLDRLSQLQEDSMLIFFAQVDGLINFDYTVNETIPDHRWKILASIAVGMSKLDKDYVAAAVANGLQPASIYDMIVSGLGYLDQSNQGKPIPGYAKNVLNKRADAIFLLQLRHNYSAAIVVNNFTGLLTSDLFADASTVSSIISIPSFLAKPAIRYFTPASLDVDLSSPQMGNVAKLQQDGIQYLDFAIQAQEALTKFGIPLEFNDTLMKIFANLNFTSPPDQNDEAAQIATVTELNQKVAFLKTAYADSVANATTPPPAPQQDPSEAEQQ